MVYEVEEEEEEEEGEGEGEGDSYCSLLVRANIFL